MFKDYKDIEMYNNIAHAKRCVKDYKKKNIDKTSDLNIPLISGISDILLRIGGRPGHSSQTVCLLKYRTLVKFKVI